MKKTILNYSIIAFVCLLSLLGLYLTKVMDKGVSAQEQKVRDSQKLDNKAKELLEALKDKNLLSGNPEKLAQIIEIIGQRRIAAAIPDLIDYLNFRRIHSWEGSKTLLHPLPEEGDYPAIGALFSIGKPALPALVKVIEEKELDSIESKNAIKTIQLIFREDLSEGVKYLENAMVESTMQDSKQKLQYAVEKTKTEWIKIQN